MTTIVSNHVVSPGSMLYDRIRVSGLGETPARIGVELFGPFGTRAEIDAPATPYWQGVSLRAKGDGELRSASVRLARAGFYTYRERILRRAARSPRTETKCAARAETALAAPASTPAAARAATRRQVGAPAPRAPTRVTHPVARHRRSGPPCGHQRRERRARRAPELGRTSLVERRCGAGRDRGTVLDRGPHRLGDSQAGLVFPAEGSDA